MRLWCAAMSPYAHTNAHAAAISTVTMCVQSVGVMRIPRITATASAVAPTNVAWVLAQWSCSKVT